MSLSLLGVDTRLFLLLRDVEPRRPPRPRRRSLLRRLRWRHSRRDRRRSLGRFGLRFTAAASLRRSILGSLFTLLLLDIGIFGLLMLLLLFLLLFLLLRVRVVVGEEVLELLQAQLTILRRVQKLKFYSGFTFTFYDLGYLTYLL